MERLERRLLLTAVNPGEPALLHDGDQLFFVQGEDTQAPSDLGGQPRTVVVATFTGDGAVDIADLGALSDNYGQSASGAEAVPGLAGPALPVLGALALLMRRRR